MDYFPLFLRLQNQPVLLVGGGAVAARKFALLQAAGADITVIAPTLGYALSAAESRNELRWIKTLFIAEHVEGARLVIAASDDPQANARVARAADARGIFVNVVDDTAHSSAIVPAIIDRSPILVAISSGGASPVLATDIRGRIEALLEPSIAELAQLAQRLRKTVAARIRDNDQRRRFWRGLLTGEVARLVGEGRIEQAEQSVRTALSIEALAPPIGQVLLVGAGPGDPGLLTLNAHRALQDADVVLYDRLVSDEVRAMGRRDAEWIEVGKRHGEADLIQHDIAALMLRHAQAGKRVVRLKGGDPMLFARIEEELEVLKTHAIPFQILPGITSASACAAYAGIPLTARGSADAVRLITAAHCQVGHEPDWASLARGDDTLVVYMGVSSIARNAQELLRHGRPGNTPVALVENASRRSQRVFVTTLAQAADVAQSVILQAPALLIIGQQAERALRFGWFGAAAIDARAQPAWRAAA